MPSDAAVDPRLPRQPSWRSSTSDGRFELAFRQHGLLRPLGSAELSDGTLRYLLWVAALLSPRPPPLLVLNEPETSLHPELLPAFARPDRLAPLAHPARRGLARRSRSFPASTPPPGTEVSRGGRSS